MTSKVQQLDKSEKSFLNSQNDTDSFEDNYVHREEDLEIYIDADYFLIKIKHYKEQLENNDSVQFIEAKPVSNKKKKKTNHKIPISEIEEMYPSIRRHQQNYQQDLKTYLNDHDRRMFETNEIEEKSEEKVTFFDKMVQNSLNKKKQARYRLSKKQNMKIPQQHQSDNEAILVDDKEKIDEESKYNLRKKKRSMSQQIYIIDDDDLDFKSENEQQASEKNNISIDQKQAKQEEGQEEVPEVQVISRRQNNQDLRLAKQSSKQQDKKTNSTSITRITRITRSSLNFLRHQPNLRSFERSRTNSYDDRKGEKSKEFIRMTSKKKQKKNKNSQKKVVKNERNNKQVKKSSSEKKKIQQKQNILQNNYPRTSRSKEYPKSIENYKQGNNSKSKSKSKQQSKSSEYKKTLSNKKKVAIDKKLNKSIISQNKKENSTKELINGLRKSSRIVDNNKLTQDKKSDEKIQTRNLLFENKGSEKKTQPKNLLIEKKGSEKKANERSSSNLQFQHDKKKKSPEVNQIEKSKKKVNINREDEKSKLKLQSSKVHSPKSNEESSMKCLQKNIWAPDKINTSLQTQQTKMNLISNKIERKLLDSIENDDDDIIMKDFPQETISFIKNVWFDNQTNQFFAKVQWQNSQTINGHLLQSEFPTLTIAQHQPSPLINFYKKHIIQTVERQIRL